MQLTHCGHLLVEIGSSFFAQDVTDAVVGKPVV